jgi:hypothetical protein
MAKKNVHVIRGVVHWAKVLGDPVMNYQGDGREWTVDLTPDAEGIAKLEELGLGDRIKDKGDDRGRFMQFRQREKRKDGSLNRSIAVMDVDGNPWPATDLIGNGSTVDLKFEYKDYGAGKFAGVYPQAIRILERKEYVPQHFAPLDDDDEFKHDAPAEKPKEGALPKGMEPELDDDFPE